MAELTDVYYSYESVRNESSVSEGGEISTDISCRRLVGGTVATHVLERTPIVAGTLTGIVYDGTVAVQTFVVNENGVFTFSDVDAPTTKVINATMNLTTGEMVLTWNSDPGTNHIVVSYEYICRTK